MNKLLNKIKNIIINIISQIISIFIIIGLILIYHFISVLQIKDNIRDKKCKHIWKITKRRIIQKSLFKVIDFDHTYSYCKKCGSTKGDLDLFK